MRSRMIRGTSTLAKAVVVLAMMSGSAAAQEELPSRDFGLYVDGEVRPRLELRLNSALGVDEAALAVRRFGTYDRISQRSRLGVTFDQTMWSARISLIAVSIWGQSGLMATEEFGLSLHEGWVEMRPIAQLALKGGRFPIS